MPPFGRLLFRVAVGMGNKLIYADLAAEFAGRQSAVLVHTVLTAENRIQDSCATVLSVV